MQTFQQGGLSAAVNKLAGLLGEVVYYYCWVVPGFHRRKHKLNDPKLLGQYGELLIGLREKKIARPDQAVSDILVALFAKKLTLGALGTTITELRTFAPKTVGQDEGKPWLKDG